MSVARAWRYPVKSFLGEELTSLDVAAHGVVGDRAYAVQDLEDRSIAAAKNPRKWGSLLTASARYLEEPSAGDDAPPPVLITLPDGTRTRSDQDADAVLSSFLGRPVRLLDQKVPDAKYEYLHPRFRGTGPPGEFDVDEPVLVDMAISRVPSFVDLAPLHVLTMASLRRLREASGRDELGPERFRANVLLDAEGVSFLEQDWPGQELKLGDVELTASMATPRCIMITLQHGDIPADRTPFKTIGQENTVELGSYGKFACFGVYATVNTPGDLAVGDMARAQAAVS